MNERKEIKSGNENLFHFVEHLGNLAHGCIHGLGHELKNVPYCEGGRGSDRAEE